MATDGDTAQVGPMLAELLGIPHAADVSRVERVEDGRVTLERMSDDGYRAERLPLPSLLTVVKEINVPRLPSVTGVLRAARAEVMVWDAVDVGASPGGHRPARLAHARGAHIAPRRKKAGCRMLDGFAALMEALKAEV